MKFNFKRKNNTMSEEFKGEVNSISSLDFYWVAEFNNFYLKQFDNDVENKFQKVIDNFSELKYFLLRHKNIDLSITVDLKQGLLFINKHQTNIDEFIKEEKKNIRLIYFRRHRCQLNEQGKEISHQIWYFIGLQYLDKNGQNRKILLQLDKDGNIIIGNR